MVEALKRKNTEGSTAVWNMRKCINFEDSDHMSSLSVSGSAVCSLLLSSDNCKDIIKMMLTPTKV